MQRAATVFARSGPCLFRPDPAHPFRRFGPGLARFTTQMYVAGEPLNERDGVLMGVRDPAARARLIVPLRPAADEPNALAGRFDIVLG